MSIIMHVDMNSYFATVEQQTNPFLRGKPICVAGKGSNNFDRTVCCAASIEAKKFGIKSGCPIWEAKKLCSQIILVPADYHKYEYISRQVFRILESYSPLMEIFSIDEAFLDLSHMKNISAVIDIANNIKMRIRTEIGDYLKCSVGISHNKLLAKLASEMKKPDGLTIIDKNNIDNILAKTPVEDLCGVGRRLKDRLNNLGIRTVKEMGECPVEKLISIFGPHQGKLLHFWGLGKDFSPVNPYFELGPEKSFGHSYTLPKDLSDLKAVNQVLLKLSEKVGRRMRRAKVFGRTIQLYVRFFDFQGESARVTLPRFLNAGLEIFKIGGQLLYRIGSKKPIRAIGVSVTNLEKEKNIPRAFLTADCQSEKAMKAVDIINDRFGEFTVFPAAIANVKNRIQQIPDGRNKRFDI